MQIVVDTETNLATITGRFIARQAVAVTVTRADAESWAAGAYALCLGRGATVYARAAASLVSAAASLSFALSLDTEEIADLFAGTVRDEYRVRLALAKSTGERYIVADATIYDDGYDSGQTPTPATSYYTADEVDALIAAIGGTTASETVTTLSTAAGTAGTASEYSRGDHRHAVTPAGIGAEVAGAAAAVAGNLASHVSAHPAPTNRDTRNEAAGAVSGHAMLDTGVHGVGAGTVAKVADITAAQAGAPALSLLTAAGGRYRATGAGVAAQALPAVALGNISGAPSNALTPDAIHSFTLTGNLTSWESFTGLENGEGCLFEPTRGAFSMATTCLTAAWSGALDDIATAIHIAVWKGANGTLYGACKA